MINLLISILLFNVLIVFFKLFEKFNIDNLQALIVNYLTSIILSLFLIEVPLNIDSIFQQSWTKHAIILGFLFISVFSLFAYSTQKVGIVITSVINKMSFVIPVIISFYIYSHEIFTLNKLIGIILAMVGVFLASTKKKGLIFNKKYIWLLIIIFFGQGFADIILNDSKLYIKQFQEISFFLLLFLSASIFGIIFFIIKYISVRNKINYRNIIAGIIFGIPNFYSILYFLKALQDNYFIERSSLIFPLTSVGIVISTSLLGVFIFKENLITRNFIGIVLAMISIYIISL